MNSLHEINNKTFVYLCNKAGKIINLEIHLS